MLEEVRTKIYLGVWHIISDPDMIEKISDVCTKLSYSSACETAVKKLLLCCVEFEGVTYLLIT